MRSLQLLYNRLRSAGWEAVRIEGALRLPAGRPMLRLRHPVRMWNGEERTLWGHSDGVTSCAISPDGHRIVSASIDATLKVWDLTSGQLLSTLDGHSTTVTSCAITPDGQRIVSASHDKSLKVWSLSTGQLLSTLQGHSGRVMACSISPDGQRIVSASADNTLKVWSLATGQLLSTLPGHSGRVMACAISPDGQRIVSASHDKTLNIWDLVTGQLLSTLSGHSARVVACAISPDGQRIVSASHDSTLKVWDLASGQLLSTLQGHSTRVVACAISPDGERIVSASHDRTLKVWDLATGQLLSTLQGHSSVVLACAISPDGRRIASASYDKTLKLWDLTTARCQVTAHASSPFACLATAEEVLCAGDEAGSLWIFDLNHSTPTRTNQGRSTPTPVRLFFSYSHKDEALRDELETHLAMLKREGVIHSWHDRRIEAGEAWAEQIDRSLEEADVILLLVSPNFLASDFCYEKEMKRALERHHAGQARVIPVILRPADWTSAPFARLQALPRDARPVTRWEDQDEAWTDVARGIRRAVEALSPGERPPRRA